MSKFLVHGNGGSFCNIDITNNTIALRFHEVLHLHGFDRDEIISLLDLLASLDKDLDDTAGHGALDDVGGGGFGSSNIVLSDQLPTFDGLK